MEALLNKVRLKYRTEEATILNETKRILNDDLFSGRKILSRLEDYKDQVYLLDENQADTKNIFYYSEIKKVSLNHRLVFSESEFFKRELPYEAILKIEALNKSQKKNISHLYVLSTPEAFNDNVNGEPAALFAKTNHNNYYLVHYWGNSFSMVRKVKYWPLMSFEKMGIAVFILAFVLAMLIPSDLILRDPDAPYLNGYRLAMIFHLLILFSSVIIFFMFAFNIKFTNQIWKRFKT